MKKHIQDSPRYALYALVLLLTTVIFHSIEFRVAAWNVDEFIFETGGQAIAAGETLYRDFGDNKPPLIFYTFALINTLSNGDSVAVLYLSKLCTIIAVFLAAVCLWYIGTTLFGGRVGMLAGLFYAAYTICAQSSEVLGGRTEVYATLMSAVSICFFVRKGFRPGYAGLAACGFFMALATLYNTRFGIMIAACGLFLLYRSGFTRKTAAAIAVCAASFVPLIAMVPLYFFREGVLDHYTFWQSTVFKHYLAAVPIYLKVLSGFLVLYFGVGLIPLVIFAVYGARKTYNTVIASRMHAGPAGTGKTAPITARLAKLARPPASWDREDESVVFLLMLLVFQYASFFAGGIPGVRYFYMMFIPVCLLGAKGCVEFYGFIAGQPAGTERLVVRTSLAALLIIVPVCFYAIHMNTRRPTINESTMQYRPIAGYIREHTGEKDRIFVWRDVSPVYLDSGRLPATSMIYPGEYLLRYYYFTGDFSRETTAWDILMRQLAANMPAVIIDYTADFSTGGEKKFLYYRRNEYIEKKADEMRAFIERNYRYIDTIGGYRVYRPASNWQSKADLIEF